MNCLFFFELARRPDFFLGIFVGRLDCRWPIVSCLPFLLIAFSPLILSGRPGFLVTRDVALYFISIHALGLLHPFLLLVVLAISLVGAIFLFNFCLLQRLLFLYSLWLGVLLYVCNFLLELALPIIVATSFFILA